MLKHHLMRSTKRIVLKWKTFNFEFFERMNKLRFPVINDSAGNTIKRPLPSKPIKIRDVETLPDTKHSADSSGVEKIHIRVFLNE